VKLRALNFSSCFCNTAKRSWFLLLSCSTFTPCDDVLLSCASATAAPGEWESVHAPVFWEPPMTQACHFPSFETARSHLRCKNRDRREMRQCGIDGRGVDAHAHLSGTSMRLGKVEDVQDLWPATCRHANRFHHYFLTSSCSP